MRPKADLHLEPQERKVLVGWARKSRAAGQLAQRARVVLLCADGDDNKAVAAKTGASEQTVGKWRRRFIASRLTGLVDQPRSGAPSTIAIADVEQTVMTTLERPAPDGRWTTRSLASALGLSQSTVSRIWRAFGIQSRNAGEPAFADEVADVLGLFVRPSERAILVVAGQPGGDDRHSGSLLDRLRRGGPLATLMPSGQPATELGEFLGSIEPFLPADEQVYLVVSGCGRHASTLWRWLEKDVHHHLHFVATVEAWSDLVDRWFARLTGAPLGHGVGLASMPTFARYVALADGAVRPLQRQPKPR